MVGFEAYGVMTCDFGVEARAAQILIAHRLCTNHAIRCFTLAATAM